MQSYADELADLRDEGSAVEAQARQGEVQRKIEALYEADVVEAFYADLDVDYLRTSGHLPDLVTGSAATVRADSGAALREQLRDYVASDGRFWPLVKRTVVRGPFDALRYGATVVDLPGLNDPNPAREAVTTHVLQKTNFVWLVYNMRRALTREITDVLRERDLFRRLVLDGRYGGLTAVGTAADAIDPEVDGETFGIDPEEELAIAAARGAESRKHVVEQLSDLVNQLEDASSDSSTHAIGERMRSQLAAIPSFSVSARDYLDLIGAQRHRQRLAPDEEATGIPELVRHIGEMSRQNGPDAHEKSIENRLQALRVEVRAAAAQSKNFSRSRDSVDFGKEVQSAARDARRFLDDSTREMLADLKHGLRANDDLFNERVSSAIERATSRLPGVHARWGAIHWATLRASCRADGAFHSSSGSYFDLPGDLSGLFFDTVALAWADYFGARLTALVDQALAGLMASATKYRAELAEALIPIVGTDETMKEQRRAIETAVEQLARRKSAELKRRLESHVSDQRAVLQDEIVAYARAALRPALRRAAAESGSGMKGRMLDILREASKATYSELGPRVSLQIQEATAHLSQWVEGQVTYLKDEATSLAGEFAREHVGEAEALSREGRALIDKACATLLAEVPEPSLAS